MKKLLTAAMAAITLGGAVLATAAPAEARPHGYYGGGYYGGYHHHDNTGAAVAAGVVGLALGAALASNHGYYNRGYYGGGYYPAYGYAYAPPAYRVCESTRWVWDPYIGRRVPVTSSYAC
ncbi:MAG TPA: hypothetical protein VFW13_10585 [Phenylobacterium sp.]|nr:hypothetical protein [Phenylobacterium sp.]